MPQARASLFISMGCFLANIATPASAIVPLSRAPELPKAETTITTEETIPAFVADTALTSDQLKQARGGMTFEGAEGEIVEVAGFIFDFNVQLAEFLVSLEENDQLESRANDVTTIDFDPDFRTFEINNAADNALISGLIEVNLRVLNFDAAMQDMAVSSAVSRASVESAISIPTFSIDTPF